MEFAYIYMVPDAPYMYAHNMDGNVQRRCPSTGASVGCKLPRDKETADPLHLTGVHIFFSIFFFSLSLLFHLFIFAPSSSLEPQKGGTLSQDHAS